MLVCKHVCRPLYLLTCRVEWILGPGQFACKHVCRHVYHDAGRPRQRAQTSGPTFGPSAREQSRTARNTRPAASELSRPAPARRQAIMIANMFSSSFCCQFSALSSRRRPATEQVRHQPPTSLLGLVCKHVFKEGFNDASRGGPTGTV